MSGAFDGDDDDDLVIIKSNEEVIDNGEQKYLFLHSYEPELFLDDDVLEPFNDANRMV